jgi:transcriptional regulator with XRE-family HTH domain
MIVKKIAQDKNLDSKQLAMDLEISQTHAINLIKGVYAPSLKLMRKIRQVYNIPLGGL